MFSSYLHKRSTTSPYLSSPKPLAPRLDIPDFDPLSFSGIFSEMLDEDQNCFEETAANDRSIVDIYCDSQKYMCIKDVSAEWDDEPTSQSPSFECSRPDSSTSSIAQIQTHSSDESSCSVASSISMSLSLSDIPLLSDFLVDPTSFNNDVGVCLRLSNGRPYAIKKRVQTRQAWSELDILLKVREARIPFCPVLHWTYERDQYIYLIMENYPSVTLADVIGNFGVFGPLDTFFYACELLVGLRFLHDIQIIHRGVSPETIIFDRSGHLILSGLEAGAVLGHNDKFLVDVDRIIDYDKRYQAPEILLGWCHDELVDSWSFGLALYFMFHGKHALLDAPDRHKQYSSKDIVKVLLEELPIKAFRFINPIARDLILKCLERNPGMRATIQNIQRHPYFSSAKWDSVAKRDTPAPIPRDFLSRHILRSPAISDNLDVSREQCFSPRLGPSNSENSQQSFSEAFPQFLGSPFVTPRKDFGTPASIHLPIAQSTMIFDQGSRTSSPYEILASPHISPRPGLSPDNAQDSRARNMANFWDTLDREEDQLSTHTVGGYSVLSNIKIPFSRAWNLRKERSLMFYPHQLFSLSTASIQQKLKRRPKSIAALKYAAYAEPIKDLPSGLSQIGSGIGFNYAGPSRVPPTTFHSAEVNKTTEADCSGLGLQGSGSDLDASRVPDRSRNSMSSEFTVAVPNACHGLFQSLNVSSFWTGLRSGPMGVGSGIPVPSPRTSAMTLAPKNPQKTSIEVDGLPPRSPSASAVRLPSPGPCELDHSNDEVNPQYQEITQPLAESTAFLSPIPEALSPTTISTSPSTSTVTDDDDSEEVLTPETVEFHQDRVGGRTSSSEEDIVEMKRSEEVQVAYPHFQGPESTLRLVTPMNGLRLALADGGPYPS
ncbi:hypothetical protein NP233_g3162 [Leucocoprinus birnbaumii]|uniref:Protein kinase domain-containing protein n=1 Tax=Leucocoprinus birnbaumii TaxID=56174 RepID=A0AAD5VWZ4_9AGAR|nr:hypothetical protein NP233_g3162 [Leucocoprinus birnbaumii]